MKPSKVLNTQVVQLPTLISVINTIPGIDFGRNREMIITDLLALTFDRVMVSFYDIAIELSYDDVLSVIVEYIPITHNMDNLINEILSILNTIKEDLIPIIILESLPNTIVEVSYILNEYVTFRLYDIHPIERVRRIV